MCGPNNTRAKNDLLYTAAVLMWNTDLLFRNRPPAECPDYMSSGPNSCYFDTEHTEIWNIYCMNVTAQSSRGSFTSNEHCLDVADIGKVLTIQKSI